MSNSFNPAYSDRHVWGCAFPRPVLILGEFLRTMKNMKCNPAALRAQLTISIVHAAAIVALSGRRNVVALRAWGTLASRVATARAAGCRSPVIMTITAEHGHSKHCKHKNHKLKWDEHDSDSEIVIRRVSKLATICFFHWLDIVLGFVFAVELPVHKGHNKAF